MKMSSVCSFIFMQIKVIFMRMVSHLDSRFETEAQGNSEIAYLLGADKDSVFIQFRYFKLNHDESRCSLPVVSICIDQKAGK